MYVRTGTGPTVGVMYVCMYLWCMLQLYNDTGRQSPCFKDMYSSFIRTQKSLGITTNVSLKCQTQVTTGASLEHTAECTVSKCTPNEGRPPGVLREEVCRKGLTDLKRTHKCKQNTEEVRRKYGGSTEEVRRKYRGRTH